MLANSQSGIAFEIPLWTFNFQLTGLNIHFYFNPVCAEGEHLRSVESAAMDSRHDLYKETYNVNCVHALCTTLGGHLFVKFLEAELPRSNECIQLCHPLLSIFSKIRDFFKGLDNFRSEQQMFNIHCRPSSTISLPSWSYCQRAEETSPVLVKKIWFSSVGLTRPTRLLQKSPKSL